NVTGAVAGFPIGAISFTFDAAAIANAASAEAGKDATTVASHVVGAEAHTYTGSVAPNSNYIGATSDPEPFVVDKKQLVITTTVHDAAHAVITNDMHALSLHDALPISNVTGAVAGFPIGAISFTFDAAAIANAASAEAGFDATTVASGALGAGTHTYTGSVATNANYIGATSDPEPFVVDKAPTTTTTVTQYNGQTIMPGVAVTDTATVTGAVTGFPLTGSVTFWLCQPADVALNGGDCHTGGSQVGGAKTINVGGQ